MTLLRAQNKCISFKALKNKNKNRNSRAKECLLLISSLKKANDRILKKKLNNYTKKCGRTDGKHAKVKVGYKLFGQFVYLCTFVAVG